MSSAITRQFCGLRPLNPSSQLPTVQGESTGKENFENASACSSSEQFAFFDLPRKLRRGADRLQLFLRPGHNNLRSHGERTSAVWQQFPFHALCEFAGLWRTLVIDEATPTGVLSDGEVSLRTLDECAPIETRFRRGSVIVRRTTHHRNQLQKLQETRIVGSRFRMHHESQGLITLSFESRLILRKQRTDA